jgi:hypothetical protein
MIPISSIIEMPGRFDVQLEAQVWMQIVGSVSLLFNLPFVMHPL